nr:MAG TPA: hypothetical protein [Caudoviricetes sp.]
MNYSIEQNIIRYSRTFSWVYKCSDGKFPTLICLQKRQNTVLQYITAHYTTEHNKTVFLFAGL